MSHLEFIIGGESVFKTMSSMSKIKTLVIHEDNNNRFTGYRGL
jgi:hypothetical protein